MSIAVPSKTQNSNRRRPAQRADGRKNRERLVDATGELLGRGRPFTLAEVGAAAQLSTATAYRHFRSPEDATEAFVGRFWDEMDATVAAAGPELELRRLCGVWVRAVLEWGPALVQLRSQEGFLARRSRGDERVLRLVRILEQPVTAELVRSGTPPSAEQLSYAVALWNAIADPREILDQRSSLGWGARKIAERLHRTVAAALGC